jgi:predicted naringenin-chalcone synthase
VVLVICVELCSLHFRADCHPQQLVAAALFADGAAAAIVDGGGGGWGQLDIGQTLVIDEASDAMTWRIVDDGFMMTLNRDVPVALERAIGSWVDRREASGLVIHPGGPGILDAIERGVRPRAIDEHSFPAARAVLNDYGNMSSGTILFVLDRYCRTGGVLPVDLIAFGPGLTIDGVGVRPQE